MTAESGLHPQGFPKDGDEVTLRKLGIFKLPEVAVDAREFYRRLHDRYIRYVSRISLYFCAKFHVPSPSGSQITSTILKAEEKFRTTAMLLFDIQQIYDLNKSRIFSHNPL